MCDLFGSCDGMFCGGDVVWIMCFVVGWVVVGFFEMDEVGVYFGMCEVVVGIGE